MHNAGWLFLGCAAVLATGCVRPRQTNLPGGTAAPSPQQQGIIAQFERKHPELFRTLEVWGANPSGTMLCFRSNQGGTYVYRAGTDRVELMDHALFIAPGQVTRITFAPDAGGASGAFRLWSGERCILSLRAGE